MCSAQLAAEGSDQRSQATTDKDGLQTRRNDCRGEGDIGKKKELSWQSPLFLSRGASQIQRLREPRPIRGVQRERKGGSNGGFGERGAKVRMADRPTDRPTETLSALVALCAISARPDSLGRNQNAPLVAALQRRGRPGGREKGTGHIFFSLPKHCVLLWWWAGRLSSFLPRHWAAPGGAVCIHYA
ncbi:hypothetical protein L209DRAFT_508468 [Thermothelomyces heterothallicus CBS 203.75]